MKNPALQNVAQEESRSRSFSDPSQQQQQPQPKQPLPANAAAANRKSVPAPSNNGTAPTGDKDNAGAGQPQQQKASALTSVIYPVLSKLLKSNQEEGDVIAALAQLKIAFDNAERAKPGITHSLIAQIIETLKR